MLDKTILGTDLYNAANVWNDVDINNIEQARKDFWNAIADKIISHFVANTEVSVTVDTTGTASAQHGTGTGTIQ